MAKKTKKEELLSFQNKLAELIEAYGIEGPAVVPSQIIDLGVDLSDETAANVYALAMAVVEEIKKVYDQYGGKPNVVVDGKIRNAMVSFDTASPEFSILVIRTLEFKYGIVMKNPSAFPDYAEFSK